MQKVVFGSFCSAVKKYLLQKTIDSFFKTSEAKMKQYESDNKLYCKSVIFFQMF